jgi:hypothetical protein
LTEENTKTSMEKEFASKIFLQQQQTKKREAEETVK